MNIFLKNRLKRSLLLTGRVNQTGFTLIELLVVIGIFAILTTLGLFLSFDFYRTYSLNAEKSTLISVLAKARSQSLANIDGQEHGVHVESGNYMFLKGAQGLYVDDFAVPTGALIEVQDEDGNNTAEIIFKQLSGKAYKGDGTTACGDDSHPCEITLIAQGIFKTVTINSEGRIDW